MISISNLSKSYDGVKALDGLSLSIERGEFFGLLGPNGAGKSTLLNILVGYLESDAGSVGIAGIDLKAKPIEARRQIGFVPQEIALYGRLTAAENLDFFGSLYAVSHSERAKRSEELLHAVGLWERRNERVNNFSGGMKRRLNIITSLMHNPSVLLCDEPTAGVDPQSRNAMFEFLQKMHKDGVTVIYTTHYMEEAERLCSRVGIIDHGHVIGLGTLDELVRLAPERPSIRITLSDGLDVDESLIGELGTMVVAENILTITPASAQTRISEILNKLDAGGIAYNDIRFDRPTLESLFLHLTGRRLRE